MRRRLAQCAAAAALAGLAVALWGGYDRRWRWTGFGGRADLWDWLHVLVLPLAFALAPLWLRHRGRLGRGRRVALTTVGLGFALLVGLGYAVPLRWTGFPGNTLWDWLELLVLPLAVVLLPVWVELAEGVRPRHVAAVCLAGALLAAAAVGGYEGGWRWTGFRGNTLYDWLSLFVAPLVLPLVLAPLAVRWLIEPVAAGEEPGVNP